MAIAATNIILSLFLSQLGYMPILAKNSDLEEEFLMYRFWGYFSRSALYMRLIYLNDRLYQLALSNHHTKWKEDELQWKVNEM